MQSRAVGKFFAVAESLRAIVSVLQVGAEQLARNEALLPVAGGGRLSTLFIAPSPLKARGLGVWVTFSA